MMASQTVSYDAVIINPSSTNLSLMGIFLRCDATCNNGYLILWSNGQAALYKKVAGVLTQLTNFAAGGFTVGQTVTQKVQIVGTTVSYKLWLTGNSEPAYSTFSDSTFSAPGYFGVYNGTFGTANQSSIDNVVYSTPDTLITSDDTNLLYTGRWAATGSGVTARAITINCGSYIEAAVKGTQTATLAFDATGLDATNGFPDVAYEADGGSITRVTLTASAMSVVVTFPQSGLSGHRIRIWAEGITEGGTPSLDQWNSQAAAVRFAGITVDAGGATLPIAINPNAMEVLGDSIVASVRLLSNPGGSTSTAAQMAGHNSWAQQAGRLLGLRTTVTGFGGTGVTVTGSGSVPIANTSFPSVYSGVSYSPTIKPIVVVVEDGTNDGAASGATFQAAYQTYLTTIRAAYPAAFIFCIALPTNTQAANVSTVVTAIADNRIFYLDYTGTSVYDKTSGVDTTDGTHVNVSGANKLATKLSYDIQSRLNSSGFTVGGGAQLGFFTAQ
jgi:lysophospholipase L1-like esterase